MRHVNILCIISAILTCYVGSAAALTAADSDRILRILDSGQQRKIIFIAKKVTGSGFISTAVYDKMATLLRDEYPTAVTDRLLVDEMSWLCKALASSGMEKYRQLVREVAYNSNSGKLRLYARRSLAMFDEYAARNRIIDSKKNYNPSLTVADNQLINMLKSSRMTLVRDAAKTIYRQPVVDDTVYKVAATELLRHQLEDNRSSLDIDTLCWLCKAIGQSGNVAYFPVLEKIIATERHIMQEKNSDDNFANIKLIRNAKLGLKILRRQTAGQMVPKTSIIDITQQKPPNPPAVRKQLDTILL